MAADFTRPPIARQHCRHYSYTPGPLGGPGCAVGIDLTAHPVTPCMPEPKAPCPLRAEWTDEERATWETWSDASRLRLIAAVQALPKALPIGTHDNMACPNCDSGRLHYTRTRGGAFIDCTTPFCCGAHFSIARPRAWPAP